MELNYRPANRDETDIAFRMLREAALWLQSKGIDYWQNWYSPPETHRRWVLEGFTNHEFHFVELNSELVGMYRLLAEDPVFWGQRSDSAVYIHSLTTKRSMYGKGLGRMILGHIQQESILNGVDFLRLDCGKEVPGLKEYYRSFGFVECGTTSVDEFELVLLEKQIGAANREFEPYSLPD